MYEAPLPVTAARVRSWTPGGTALVTGATGRLGKHVVRWLAGAGAGHLVLLSRTAAEHPRPRNWKKNSTAPGWA